MTPRTRIKLLALAACSAPVSLPACSQQYAEIPKSICGTRVAQRLTEPLLRTTGKVSEWHTAGWGERETN